MTAALQGLANHSPEQAAVALASPYLNQKIHEATKNADGTTDKATNLAAHAVLSAIEAQITGNNALAGAAAGVAAEGTAMLIAEKLYEKPIDKLTDSEKQNVVFLSELASGLAGGITGNSTADVVAGAETGKRAVENNFFEQVFNNPQVNWQSVAEGEKAKNKVEKEIREYIQKEHPVIYQTTEGTYYFLNKAGQAIYITRELVIDIAPMVIAPEIAVGTKLYGLAARAGLSGGANIVAQQLSGQEFNIPEFAGAITSGTVSPAFKTTAEVVRFNMGVGMATGLANGGDGLSDGVLSGVASYGASKISNPIWSSAVGEFIPKIPEIITPVFDKGGKD